MRRKWDWIVFLIFLFVIYYHKNFVLSLSHYWHDWMLKISRIYNKKKDFYGFEPAKINFKQDLIEY